MENSIQRQKDYKRRLEEAYRAGDEEWKGREREGLTGEKKLFKSASEWHNHVCLGGKLAAHIDETLTL